MHDFSSYIFSWGPKQDTTSKEKMNLGGGSTVKLNPIGLAVVCLVVVLLIYFNFGGSNHSNTANFNDNITNKAISLKALLAVSIEMAKRGGIEVKTIRDQVCF